MGRCDAGWNPEPAPGSRQTENLAQARHFPVGPMHARRAAVRTRQELPQVSGKASSWLGCNFAGFFQHSVVYARKRDYSKKVEFCKSMHLQARICACIVCLIGSRAWVCLTGLWVS